MQRASMLTRLREHGERPWDLVVIGGGATGLGIAVDAAARGYAIVLLEQADFAAGTSSRSTKLVHGGVRYLAQGDVGLVREALHERGLLLRNAPHLVRNLPFIIPTYTWWDGPFYALGMKLYDAMAGHLGLGPSEAISAAAARAAIPNLDEAGLRAGVRYFDGQFDDARLAIDLARTAADHGAVLLNHCPATGFLKTPGGTITGVTARDAESGETLALHARAVINATGVFVDSVQRLDNPATPPLVTPSQGVHLVLPAGFLRGTSAIMIPHTDDGRVLFALPWHERVIVGTTDTPVASAVMEPRALQHEIDFLLGTAARYLTRDPRPADVLSVFAGLRPLAAPHAATHHPGDRGPATKELSRGHQIQVAASGLVTIYGGKWTTYRRMAADAVDTARRAVGLPERPCATEHLPIHGAAPPGDPADPLAVYGSDAPAVHALARSHAAQAAPLHPRLPYLAAQVTWAARHEMARTLEDVLARRTRALLLDARASIEAAPHAAALLAAELGRDADWQAAQVAAYARLAAGYLLS